MNSKLLDCFKMDPPLYQGSSKAFWDDEHISKSMLAAHLDSDNDGASRKLATIQKSVEWICKYVKNVEGKRLLDLGCGPGLYAEQYLIITQEHLDCFNIWNQIYSQETFGQEINGGRFETVDIFDDVCGKSFTGQEECMCGVYKKV